MQGALTNEPNAIEIEVTFRNFCSTPQAKEYALKRLDKVVRSLPNLTGAAVEIRFDRNASEDSAVVVQATLAAKGTLLRAEDSGINTTAAIDRVHDILSRRIRDWKGRKHASRRRDAVRHKIELEVQAAATDDGVTGSEVEPEVTDSIVRMEIH